MRKAIELLVIAALVGFFVFTARNKMSVYYYNKGEDYYGRQMYDDAAMSFKKALQIDPSYPMAHCGLVKVYMKEGSDDLAREELDKAKQGKSDSGEFHLELGKIYYERKMYAESFEEFSKARTMFPENAQIQNELNMVSVSYATDCLNKATDAYLAGEKRKAYALLSEAIKAKPDLILSQYSLATFYYHDHKFKEAEAKLNEVIGIDPQCWQALKLLGNIYYDRGEFLNAAGKFMAALAINPNDASTHNDLGLALMRLERYPEAAPHLQEALKLKAGDPDIQYSLASVNRDRGMYGEAVEGYKKLIAAHPDYPNVHNDLADIYSEQGRGREAAQEYAREIDNCQNKLAKDPRDIVSLTGKAYAYNGIGEANRALASVKEALAVDPDNWQANITLAKIYEKSGNYEGAQEIMNKVKISSGSPAFISRDMERISREASKTAKISDSRNDSFSDTIYLKSGRKINGNIKQETAKEVTLELKVGASYGTITLERDNILRIEKNK
ncbi:MAG: tetratricopeptide repeat protein [Candidatus Omnitrophica bacterium]|nr:tetratricopeptide repeat protein [Candidatus Omnitrophota bacterium]